jgi:hypothetical protein
MGAAALLLAALVRRAAGAAVALVLVVALVGSLFAAGARIALARPFVRRRAVRLRLRPETHQDDSGGDRRTRRPGAKEHPCASNGTEAWRCSGSRAAR